MSVQCYRLLALIAGLLLLGSLGGPRESHAQPDSVRAEILKTQGFSPDHSPVGALWRSAVVPGWGQLYNRQYYKIPFVYAGFAALGARAYQAHQEYLLFKRAHLYARGPELGGDGDTNPYQQYKKQFNEITERLGGERLKAMRDYRDQYRRRRNLAILGSGLFYALTLLDAYVSAHLLTFDVGEELTLRVHPTGTLRASSLSKDPLGQATVGPEGQGLGMRVQVDF